MFSWGTIYETSKNGVFLSLQNYANHDQEHAAKMS